ncbi:MAG: phosphoribosylglycinamide synthetase C domain-containing protein, partial [Mitsuokella sp.]
AYPKGFPIDGLTKAKAAGTLVFHAGTAEKDGQIVTAGGRVLGVVAKAANVKEAAFAAYKGVSAISFEGAFYRRDIAHRALERMK